MGWNYVATLNPGSDWSFSYLPGAAVDGSGNLWVLWGNGGSGLSYITVPLPSNGQVLPVSTTTVTNQQTNGAVSLVPMSGQQMLAVWMGWSNPTVYYGLLSAGSTTIVDDSIAATCAYDGPVATLVSAGTVFVAWSGPPLTYPNVHCSNISVGTSDPASSEQPMEGLWSWFSPSVAATPGGSMSFVFPGMDSQTLSISGANGFSYATNYSSLYYTSVEDPSSPIYSQAAQVTYTDSDGSTVTPMALGRPALALQGTGAGASLALVYTPVDAPSELHYLVGTLGAGGAVTWAPPPGNVVPLEYLLADAAVPTGQVTFTNPVGVWATAPASSDSVYLVIIDTGSDGNFTGPIYVVRYSGD